MLKKEIKDLFKNMFTGFYTKAFIEKPKTETDYQFISCPMCQFLGDKCTHRFNKKDLEGFIEETRKHLTKVSKSIKTYSDPAADVPYSLEDMEKYFPKLKLRWDEGYLYEDLLNPGHYKGNIYIEGKTTNRTGEEVDIKIYKKMTCQKVYPSKKYPDGIYTESIQIWISEAEYQGIKEKSDLN